MERVSSTFVSFMSTRQYDFLKFFSDEWSASFDSTVQHLALRLVLVNLSEIVECIYIYIYIMI